MNYRLGLVERKDLVARYLIVIIGVGAGRENCADVLKKFHLR